MPLFPAVSLIIPTHNRQTMLPHTLAALAAQNYPADRLELFLVADGCVDDTADFARNYPSPCQMHLLELPGLGPAAARNAGAAQAQGELLIFLDDDMVVCPDFVVGHIRAHQKQAQMVAVGPILLAGRPTISYFDRSLRAWWDEQFFRLRQPGYRFRYHDLFSGNMSLSAALFAQVGGFNSDLRCHEDYELGVRLLAAGAMFVYAAGATAVHHDITDAARARQRRMAEGQADVYLAHHHPALRHELPLGQGAATLLQRILRYLAFKRPSLGDKVSKTLQIPLRLLEACWLYGGWQHLFCYLQDYWYWRGVASMADAIMICTPFAEGEKPTPPEVVIDLAAGLDKAGQCLDAVCAFSARLFVGRQWVGDIPATPGAERLRPIHLQRILATELAEPLAVALALHQITPRVTAVPAPPTPDDFYPSPLELKKPSNQAAYLQGSKKVSEIELAAGIPDVDVSGYQGLYALVRGQGRPLGWITLVDLPESLITAVTLHRIIAQELGWQVIPVAWGVPESTPESWPPITVIVCTRNRPAQLATCLQSLLALDYPHYEILVVDNAPDDEQTANLVAGLPVRYAREEQPGLDWARNRGLREARHPIIAFTDDDARPDSGWLQAIARAFAEPEVTAVTGPVLPAELESPAQNLFEFGYGGMSHGFKRRVIRRATCGNRGILWASHFGAGANMAFRRSLFAEIGDFDGALDVGTPSGGGGDVEMLHRLVARGHTLVYEPNALVWHQHRREMADLQRLVSNNGRSFGCYLLTCARNRTVGRATILYFALRFWLWGWIGKRLLRPKGFPRRLIWRELLAALGSPLIYWRTRPPR